MGRYEIREARQSLPREWQRQTLDAFLAPLDGLGLTDGEAAAYTKRALAAVGRVSWESYDMTRSTFLLEAENLLKVRPLTASVMDGVRRSMYVRFMEGRILSFMDREKQEHAKLRPVPVGKDDFHNTELAAVFAHLPEQPETARWLEGLRVSWEYDQLHMVTWFAGQLSLGSGEYTRSRPNHSAKTTYERLLNPFSLLWIAAALGEERETVAAAAREAETYPEWRDKCAAVRRAVPWKRIYALALPRVEAERKANS